MWLLVVTLLVCELHIQHIFRKQRTVDTVQLSQLTDKLKGYGVYYWVEVYLQCMQTYSMFKAT